jgi:LPXTG-motif cell wall-anchored protein
MKRVLDWIQSAAVALGGPGLFILAFLDSSFLSFPEVGDVMVAILTIKQPDWMLYYAFLCTVGSVAGCYALYAVAARGGEAFLRKRVNKSHVDRAMNVFRRYGLLAVLVPSLLPPPTPFKVFVILAGVSKVRTVDFLLAVTIGRSIRFFGIGLLALLYGERALRFMHENTGTVSLVLAGLVLAGGIAWIVWRRRRRPASDHGSSSETAV